MYNDQVTATLTPVGSIQPNDVLCGRGKAFSNHEGNINFINMIKSNVQSYIDSPTPLSRSLFIIELAKIFCGDSRFLKKDKVSDKWIQIRMIQVKDKIGHAIRDIIKKKNENKTTKNNRSYIAIKKQQQNQQCENTRKFEENTSNDKKEKHHLMTTAMIATPLITVIIHDAPDENSFTAASEAATCYDKTDGDDEFIFSSTDY
jgi:hypothetical protein